MSSGAHRRAGQPALVLLQLLVFVFYLVGPTATLAEEPIADPTPSASPAASEEPAPQAAPTITSDKDDYAPAELVTLTGSNWQPGETVHIFVNDDAGSTWSRSVDVVADDAGNIVDQFNLPSWFVAEYSVTATGSISGTSTTTFTDSRTITAVTLNGAASVSVVAGSSITASVSVTTDNGGGNQNWHSTGWRISTTAPGSITCENNPNHDGSGSYVESFDITAPSTPGTYHAYFIAYSNDTCTQQASSTFTLSNAVTVTPPAVDTTTAIASDLSPSTYGSNVTFTATITAATGPNPNGIGTVDFKDGASSISGCSAVALTGNTAACTTSALTATASPHSITAVYSGGSGFNGSTSSALSQVVNQKNLTVIDAIANDKTYDADTTASVDFSGATLSGVVGTDDVTLDTTGYTADFASSDIGTWAVTVTGAALDGAAAGNYTLSQPSGLTADITARPIQITADPAGKTYGDSDPPLTYDITSGSLADDDAITGALNRAAGENVGTYAITQGTLAIDDGNGGTNYDLTFVPGVFTIGVRTVQVTADASQSKVYGELDPTLSYQITGGSLAFTDTFTGSLSRNPGEDVGTFAITQGTLSLGPNYFIDFVSDDFEITKATLFVDAVADSKTYGQADPVFGYTLSGFQFSDDETNSGITGAANCTRSNSLVEDAGLYTDVISCDPTNLEAPNYTFVTGDSADFEIEKATLFVDAVADSKTYGNADPAFGYTLSGFVNSEDADSAGVTGAADCSRTPGESVSGSPYTITCAPGNLKAANYAFQTGSSADFTIGTRSVEVTADPNQSKVYGELDPTLGYEITGGSLAFTDAFTGSLDRVAGENVGTYAITQGTLSLGSNYDLTFVTADFEITARPITVTADANQSKVYGEADPELTYTVSLDGLVDPDAFTGALSRVSGEDAGLYAITLGSLAIDDGNGGLNYELTFVPADFEITARPITVTAVSDSKVYDGTTDSDETPTISGGIVAGDTANFVQSFDNRNAGTNKTLTPSGSVDDGNGGLNYFITFVTDETGEITARPITVTADANQSKVYGEADPELTYTVSLDGLVDPDAFTGALSRVSGEDAGLYAITLGSLAIDDGNGGLNYELTFVPADFEIVQAETELTIDSDSPDPSALFAPYDVTWSIEVVAPGAGTPTGDVTVDDGEGNTCSAPVGAGECTMPTSSTIGAKTLTATYAGDTNFVGSSDTADHTVIKRSTTTDVACDPQSVALNGTTTCTVTVTDTSPGAATTPSGTVGMASNLAGSFTPCVLAGSAGLATCSSTFTVNAIGVHTVTATFAETGVHFGSGDTTTVGSQYNLTWLPPVSKQPYVNNVKAGQNVAMQFQLTDALGNPVTNAALTSFTYVGAACNSQAPDGADVPGETTNQQGLMNLGGGKYKYQWSTTKGWAGSCKLSRLNLGEGFARELFWEFKK